jgi:Fis family transcriptional regulator, factor for inversion stimulation protein
MRTQGTGSGKLARGGKRPTRPKGNGAASTTEPLRECVGAALDRYFADLNGTNPGDLYAMVMQEVEGPLLQRVMDFTCGNQSRAAELLGINRSTLRKKLRSHGLAE